MDLFTLQFEREIKFNMVISRLNAPCCAGSIQQSAREEGEGEGREGAYTFTNTLFVSLYVCLSPPVTYAVSAKEMYWHVRILFLGILPANELLYNYRHNKEYSG